MGLMTNESNKQSPKPLTEKEKEQIFGTKRSQEDSKKAKEKGRWK